jgi:hypothetical protein
MTSLADHAGALFSRHADQAGALLSKRRYCRDGTYRHCCSRWDCFGRWIFAAVAVFVCFLIFFLWACMRNRRRRQQGVAPMYGTGWMAPGQPGYQNNPNGYYQQPPPPAYGAPPAQSYPMNNYPNQQPSDGYYGQREGVQPPKSAHTNENAHQDAYAAPEGPPPNKVVR